MTGSDLVDLEEALDYLDVIEKEMKNNTRIILQKYLGYLVDQSSQNSLQFT